MDISQPPVDPISATAQKHFSVSYLYPIQRYTIANILDNIHQIVVLPTGSGKSLCFQLPALILPGLTMVILPLLSLMKDQVRRLDMVNIKNGCIKGGQKESERSELLKEIRRGEIKVLFITPESLASQKLESFFSQVAIQHLVIDEAHCVTEWGDTFRPAYMKIGQFIKKQNPDVVTAFTATASEPVINKIREILFDGLPVSTLIENPDRPNIHYSVIPALSKSRAVIKILETAERPIIIYSRSRKRAEYYAHLVRDRLNTDQVFFYHAGLTKEERKAVEEWFMQSDNGVLVATSAFGMGIDKSGVRTVIHTGIPYSVEAYLQESGRAGRDKKPARAFLFYSYEDFTFADKVVDDVQKVRFKKILHYAEEKSRCRREHLLSFLDYTLENKCTGCDFCDGNVQESSEGESELIEVVRKHRRRFSKREIIHILHGKQTYDVITKNLDRYKGFGILTDWHRDDIEESIDTLLNEGILYIPGKGFWKYSMTLGRKHS